MNLGLIKLKLVNMIIFKLLGSRVLRLPVLLGSPLVLSAFLVALGAPLAGADAQGAQLLDEVVLSINEKPFTKRELGFGSSNSRDINKWVANKLIDMEADSLGVAVGADQVDAYLAEVKRQNNLSETQFKELLQSKGVRLEDYRQEIEREIIKSRVLQSRVRSKVQVMDEDIQAFYEERPDSLPEEGSFHLLRFRIPCQDLDSCQLAERKLESLAKQYQQHLEAGPEGSPVTPLVNAARQARIEVKDFGFVAEGEMRDDLLEQVRGLSSLEFTETSSSGSSVENHFLVGNFNGIGKQLPESLRERARKELFESKFQDAIDSYLNKDLQAKYYVDKK